jgi:hypothetical protein
MTSPGARRRTSRETQTLVRLRRVASGTTQYPRPTPPPRPRIQSEQATGLKPGPRSAHGAALDASQDQAARVDRGRDSGDLGRGSELRYSAVPAITRGSMNVVPL